MVDDERPERRFEYQTDEIVMTDIDCRVLAALPTLMTDGRWPTVAEVAARDVSARSSESARKALAPSTLECKDPARVPL